MRVTLVAYGGLAAAISLHRPPAVVDSASLAAGPAGELSRLVDAAISADAHRPAGSDSGSAGSGSGRDVVGYTITVQRAGTSSVLKGSDTDASPAFAALLAWLQAHT